MARFVEREIDEVKETVACTIRRHRGENQFPSSDKQDESNDDPAAKVKDIHFRLDRKENVLKEGPVFRGIPFSSCRGRCLP